MIRQRKMMAQGLGPAAHRKYLDDIRHAVREMCLEIANKPDEWENAVKL
jgi:cytochrome P450